MAKLVQVDRKTTLTQKTTGYLLEPRSAEEYDGLQQKNTHRVTLAS